MCATNQHCVTKLSQSENNIKRKQILDNWKLWLIEKVVTTIHKHWNHLQCSMCVLTGLVLLQGSSVSFSMQ